MADWTPIERRMTGRGQAAGKQPQRKAVELPHHWDGDVLVLDISSLPDATGGR